MSKELICLNCTLKTCNERAAGCLVRQMRVIQRQPIEKRYRERNKTKYRRYWRKADRKRRHAEKLRKEIFEVLLKL
jgi:hypothetical protein